jgi:hypothetical protein
MTGDTMALRALLEKGSDASVLPEMIGFAAERLMDMETEAACGAVHGERVYAAAPTPRRGTRSPRRIVALVIKGQAEQGLEQGSFPTVCSKR